MARRNLLLLGLASVIDWTPPAAAHDWYPASCCSGRDRYEISADELVLAAMS